MTIWYAVSDLAAARRWYVDMLGFEETYFDEDGRWSKLVRDGTEIALAEGEPEEGAVAHIDVDDVKAEGDRLRDAGVAVGVVLELHGHIRLLDVFDPDGNRLQLAQEL